MSNIDEKVRIDRLREDSEGFLNARKVRIFGTGYGLILRI